MTRTLSISLYIGIADRGIGYGVTVSKNVNQKWPNKSNLIYIRSASGDLLSAMWMSAKVSGP